MARRMWCRELGSWSIRMAALCTICFAIRATAARAAAWTDMVISPRKTPESQLETTRAVTVITSKDLERWGTPFVADALRHVPGVYVRRSGGIGRVTNAIIRGSSAAHVLVLLDGVKVNSPTTGAFDFANLTTDNIERIEILRGGASTLYGSDAVGGVIQIFSKDGSDFVGLHGRVLGEMGSDRTFREVGELGWGSDRARFSSSISRLDSNGVSADDDYRNITYSAGSTAQVTDRLEMDTALRVQEGRVGIDDGAFRPDPNRRTTEKTWNASTTLHHALTNWWRQTLQVFANRSDLVDLDQPNPGTTEREQESRIVTHLLGTEWRHDVDWAEWGGLASGFELESQQGDNGRFDKSLLSWAWYLQPHLTFGRLTAATGFRLFRHNTFGRDTTWEASCAYRIVEGGPKVRVGYAQGYHAPTLNDLYFPTFSNPDLHPEESKSYEAGIDHTWWNDRMGFSATYFHRDANGLIQFSGLMPVNLGKTTQKGVEFEAKADLGQGVSLASHYAYVEAYEKPSHEELLRVPHQTAGLSLRYSPIARMAFDVRYSFVASREDVGRQKLERYHLADAVVTLALNQHAQLYVRVENLLNRHYQEIIGFPSDGARVFGGVRLTSW